MTVWRRHATSRDGYEAPDAVIADALPCRIDGAKVADEAAVRADSALEKERRLPGDGKKDMPGDIKDAAKSSLPMQAAKGTADLLIVLLNVRQGNGCSYVREQIMDCPGIAVSHDGSGLYVRRFGDRMSAPRR